METIAVKQATLADIHQLHSIGRQTFAETFAASNTPENMAKYLEDGFSLEKLTAELTHPGSAFYFAMDGEKVIGYLKLNTGASQTEPNDDNSIEIERIYVLREYHGQKAGQLLYEKALEVASRPRRDKLQRRIAYIWLGVWEENPRAIRFYQKNGFVAFGKHVFKLGDDEQTDVMMWKEL